MSNRGSDNADPTHTGSAGTTAVEQSRETPQPQITGEPGDGDATWAPRQGDPPDDGEYSDVGNDQTARPPREQQDTSPPTDSDATHVPTSGRSVEDVWGDDLEDLTPGQTLRGPKDTKPPSPGLLTLGREQAPPDLSTKGYEVREVLGEGGVGIVYQAIQKSIGREVAIKMMKGGPGQNAKEKENFVSEAQVTGKLDHPNILPIHDLDTTADGQPFYTMKMVRGTPWSDVIGKKSLAENLGILFDVCDAVSFAHCKGVVHRDLKPENAMLGEFGEVQLLDWGMGASVSEDGDLLDSSSTQAAGGTPAYMAPEMVTGEDGTVGIHSDIYLLGAILYEIITGQTPHPGKRVLESLENARNNVIRPTEHTGVLVDIALKAMQTQPPDRYLSVNDFKQSLLDYQSHAESIILCERSSSNLDEARENQDYDLFAQALFGFRQALTFWDDNPEARSGIVDTQLQYARGAFEKRDLDLAASTLDDDCPAHQDLAAEVKRARGRRSAARRRMKLLRIAAMSLTAAVIIILTVAAIWIYAAKRQADIAREAAVTAQEAEAEQRVLAESASIRARDEEARAVQALADREKAYTDLVEAQEQEKRAWAEARASERVATETRDELAKTGMLMDNSWWVFDAAEARQRQQDAATALDMPVEFSLALAEDVELVMVLVPPGDFVMGSPPKEENRSADEHLHRISHRGAFYLGKFEVTETQWQALIGQPPPSAVDRDADPALPVTGISLEQIEIDLPPAVQEHAPAGWKIRLPSEAEWEYACRAGTATAFHAGDGQDSLESVGWFLSNSQHQARPVGLKTPNAFGLHDMHGNVGEVCADQYVPGFYLESPTEDPICKQDGETPVVRGGSVLNTPEHCRSAYRSYVYRKNEYPFLGLRLVMVRDRQAAPPEEPNQIQEQSANP